MLDDVAGLVMVQVISNLGRSADSFSSVTVIRPVFVSIAFAVFVPIFCWTVVKPITKYVFAQQLTVEKEQSKVRKWGCTPVSAFAAHTLVLLGLVTGSTYAGTSNLFAAYIAGAAINWWDALVSTTLQERTGATSEKNAPKGKKPSNSSGGKVTTSSPSSSDVSTSMAHVPATEQSFSKVHNKLKGVVIYEHMYAPAMNSILKPFFFVSTIFAFVEALSANDNIRHPLAFPFPSRGCSAAPSFGAELSIPSLWSWASWPAASCSSASQARLRKSNYREASKPQKRLRPTRHQPVRFANSDEPRLQTPSASDKRFASYPNHNHCILL